MRRRRTLLAATAGYLLGTLPSADIAARLAAGSGSSGAREQVDLRDAGSGNPGALNAAQILGRRWGTGVAVADLAKGAAAGVVGRRLAGPAGAYTAATAAVAGHIFPVWSGFRGGKGIATSAGACAAVFPAYAAVDTAMAAASTAMSARRLERAMTVTCAAWVGGAVLWWRRRWPNAWGPEPTVGLPTFAAASSAMILWKFWRGRAVPPPG